MAEATTAAFTIGRIRKAVVAGFGAGVAAVFTAVTTGGLLSDGKIDANEAGNLVGAFFASFVAIGYVTFQTPNKADRHDNKDAATAAAVTQVQALAIPAPRDAEVTRTSTVLPQDPTPITSDVEQPDAFSQGRHEA